MKRRLSSLVVIAAMAVGMTAAPALAGPRTPDTDCLRAGQSTLRSLGAFKAAAKGQVNYAAFDINSGNDFQGLIRVDLGDEAFLPINQVFQLHLDSPELFAWCD